MNTAPDLNHNATDMLNILVNAYAVSPNWGSEQGMGWNWIVNLARYNRLDVITEGEWRGEIEDALRKLPQAENITFHYLPVEEKVRKMCWNQGDWRFYAYYRQWQKRALGKAREIISEKHIDVIHQLNMIGFREPGYLWKIKDIPYVWGPIGGMELMPMAYLDGAPGKQRLFNLLKNTINRWQYSRSPRVRKAIQRADALISAVKGVQDVISGLYGRQSILINETGVDNAARQERDREAAATDRKFRIIWVGKFDFRKQLPLALRAVAGMDNKDVEFHICGTGPDATVKEMKALAGKLGIGDQCVWHGNVPHDRIDSMMASSDVMLFTSIMEATSTVVLEAITAGLPVVSFDTCGFGPIVRDFAGVAIELSNPGQSARDFSAALTDLYSNRRRLSEISERIIEKRHCLTWEAKAAAVTDIYNTLAATTRPQPK